MAGARTIRGVAELEAHGRLMASVLFDGRTVTVRRRNRLLAGSGERSMPLHQIGAVVWKKAGLVTDGWLGFTTLGMVAPGTGVLAPVNDPWTVPFTRRQQPAFDALRAAIEQARSMGPAGR